MLRKTSAEIYRPLFPGGGYWCWHPPAAVPNWPACAASPARSWLTGAEPANMVVEWMADDSVVVSCVAVWPVDDSKPALSSNCCWSAGDSKLAPDRRLCSLCCISKVCKPAWGLAANILVIKFCWASSWLVGPNIKRDSVFASSTFGSGELPGPRYMPPRPAAFAPGKLILLRLGCDSRGLRPAKADEYWFGSGHPARGLTSRLAAAAALVNCSCEAVAPANEVLTGSTLAMGIGATVLVGALVACCQRAVWGYTEQNSIHHLQHMVAIRDDTP